MFGLSLATELLVFFLWKLAAELPQKFAILKIFPHTKTENKKGERENGTKQRNI